MRSLKCLACLSILSLAACDTPDNGYYDANGNWVPYNRYNAQAHTPLPGGTRSQYDYDDDRVPVTTTVTTYTFDRPGYYDYQGYYTEEQTTLGVPRDMLPPRGMCRVWLPHRTPAHQPPVESCDDIRARVPAGAYVIYGG